MPASDFAFYFRLAKAIAQQFGSNCEVVVHDLESNDPESSIEAIENGHAVKSGTAPPMWCWTR